MSEGSRRYLRVRATRPPRVQEWEAPDPGQRRHAIPRALTNGSSRGTLHSGPKLSVAELGLGWTDGGRSTGELGIGDELLCRQLLQFSYTDRTEFLLHGGHQRRQGRDELSCGSRSGRKKTSEKTRHAMGWWEGQHVGLFLHVIGEGEWC
ncbi:hypothetical protein ACQJBY_028475 [Aegilops geniculata]